MPSGASLAAVHSMVSPSLNYDDAPEAGFTACRQRRRQKHRPSRFHTVFEEQGEEKNWENYPEVQKLETSIDEQWSCVLCTFLNRSDLLRCEMCDQPRVPLTDDSVLPPARYLLSPTACEVSMDNIKDKPDKTRGIKWPSLLQSVEKSWDLCDQSSMASSMIDVAKLEDVEGAREDAIEAITIGESTAEFFDIFSETGSQLGGTDTGDIASVASSWYHAAKVLGATQAESQSDIASVASSWLDVGNLVDVNDASETNSCIETSLTYSWLEVNNSTDLAMKTVQPSESEDSATLVIPGKALKDQAAATGRFGGTTWSSVVSHAGTKDKAQIPKRSSMLVPPLVRRPPLPKKKSEAMDPCDEFFEDRDERGCARAHRQYRRCR